MFEKLAIVDLLEPTRRHASRDVWQREVSREGARFLEQRRQSPPFGVQSFDLTGLRAGMGARHEPTVPGVKLTKLKVGDVPCEWVMTPDADPDVRFLYLHGGGWVSGSGGDYLPLAAEISLAARCVVLLPDYRLAPERPFPAGLDQLGQHEMLRDDAIRVTKKARADGIPVTLEIWPGMVHVFQIRGLPESREAIQRIGKFVKSTPGS